MSGNAANIQGNLHVDRVQTNYSLQYALGQQDYVAGKATSRVTVLKSSDAYVTYDRGHFLRDEMEERPLGGTPVQVGYKLGSDNYNAREYALEHFIDDRQRANVDAPINLDMNATRLLTTKSLIKRDRTWVQRFFKTGVWSTEYNGVTTGAGGRAFLQFSEAGSNPIKLIDEIRDGMAQSTGLTPNTLVMGVNVRRKLKLNADIVDRIKYTQLGVVTDELLASLFGVDNVVTPKAIYNNALEGTPDNFQFISDPNAMWMGYIDPNPVIDSPTAIATFAWTGLHDGAGNENGGVILRGRDDRASSDWIQIRDAWDMKLVAQDLGIFFRDVVAP